MHERDTTLAHQLLEQQARLRPDAMAVLCGDSSLTYEQLNALANGIAAWIADRALEPESRVGISVTPGPGLVAALFGVLKSGCAYTPLDASMPAERLRFIASDCEVPLVIGDATIPALKLLTESLDPSHCTPLDENPNVEMTARNLAYTIYTSGSTGTPNGVMVEHASLVNFATAQTRIFPVDENSRILQFSSFTFDAATSDIVTAVAAGAVIICAPRDETLTPVRLAALVRRHAVDTVTLPPSLLSMLDPGDFPGLRVVVTVGQHCTQDIIDRWAGNVRLINGYGPTEATIGTTLGVQKPSDRPHIGVPLENTCVYLLDENGAPVPNGQVGEIYIGGAGVARGYVNRNELTEARFRPDPFCGREGLTMFRTYDRGRLADDGNLEILGRMDRVVKLHGQRIDLDDVEFNMLAHDDVMRAAVLFEPGVNYDDRLVAFFVRRPGSVIEADAVRQHLCSKLSAFMVPSAICRVDQLPSTTSGKTDYKILRERAAERTIVLPSGETRDLAELICKLLKINRISPDKSFLDQGGNSISALRLCNRLRSRWNVDLSVASVLDAENVGALINQINNQSGTA